MKKEKIFGFLALPRSYFSLVASPTFALMVSFLIGLTDVRTLLLLGSFFLLATAFLNSYNNLMDARADALTKDRFPIPLGLVTLREGLLFSIILFIAAAIIALPLYNINNLSGYVAYINLFLAFLYSAPKIRLKRFPFVKGSILVAHTLLIPFFMANLILGHNPTERLTLVIPLFLIGIGTHTIQDIGDIQGDKVMGDKTIPIILGVKNSVALSLLMVVISAILLTTYETPLKQVTLVLIIAEIPPLLLLLIRKDAWKYVFWLCSALSAGVVASLLYGCCS
jgi:4-hydroxybenzoate polyprenyltransferase